jgi:hypothetical protein
LSNAPEVTDQTDDWSKLGVPKSFTFDSLTKVVKVNIAVNGTNVYDSRNNIIAENLPIGDYSFTIPQFEKLVLKTPVSLKSSNIYLPLSFNDHFIYTRYTYGAFVVEDTYPYGGDFDYNDVAFNYTIKETRELVPTNLGVVKDEYSGKFYINLDTSRPLMDTVITCEIIINPIAMGVGAFNTYGLIAHVAIGDADFDIVRGGKFYNNNFDTLDYKSDPIYKTYNMFSFNPDSTESNVKCSLGYLGGIIPITDDLTRSFGEYFHFYDRLFINSYNINKVAKPITILIHTVNNSKFSPEPVIHFSVINNERKNEIPYMTSNGNIDDANKIISTPLTLNVPFHFKCPRESVHFWDAYPQFLDWAKSNGQSNQDWMNYPNNDLIVK